MIESGSLSSSVDPRRFGLPPHTAVRYERPDPALEGLIADYHVLDSEPSVVQNAVEWLLPNSAAIRVILADQPIKLTLAETHYDPLPVAGFFGTTSRAMKMEVSGGLTVGINLTACGFARLLRTNAAKLRDRIVPLNTLLAPELVEQLVNSLRDHDRGRRIKAILDAFFQPLMKKPHRDEPDLIRIGALLLDDRVDSLTDAAEQVGIPSHRLLRLSQRHFGFPPKTLLMRGRLLRSIIALKQADGRTGYGAIDHAYCDDSHFVRDAKRFLGMTPRQFLQLETPYLDAVLRARTMVLGSTMAALHQAD